MWSLLLPPLTLNTIINFILGIGFNVAKKYIENGAQVIIITDLNETNLANAGLALQKFADDFQQSKTTAKTPTTTTATKDGENSIKIVTKCVDVTDEFKMSQVCFISTVETFFDQLVIEN